MRAVRGLAVLLVALASGCGGDDDPVVGSSADPRRNVLVIDDGFDLTVPVFEGRVAASYSIVCHQSGALTAQAGDGGPPPPVEADGGAPVGGDGGAPAGMDAGLRERKAALLAGLRVKEDRCRLEPGLEPKPDPLASIARFRERWNQAIRGSRYASNVFTEAERAEIQLAMDNLDDARFHGTATAGLVAHANPAVRLVLVEERLGSAEMVESTFTCIPQQEIDDNVALFSDPEVWQAYVDRPFSQLEDDLRLVAERHRIGVINESFGTFSRQRLEELQASKGCPPIELRRYFAVLGEMDAARAIAHPEPNALLVKSAGNDKSRLDRAEDHPMCNMAVSQRLIVGAYEHGGMQASFSNFGPCIDVVTPGHRIITPIPGNWYLPLSGTSFSAPLTARLVSVNPEPVPFTPAGARALVLSMRDATGRIPVHRFPRELLYDPEMAANRYALTVRTAPPRAPISLRKLREFQDLLRLGRAPPPLAR